MRALGVFKDCFLLSTIILKSAITICYTSKPVTGSGCVVCVAGMDFFLQAPVSIYCSFFKFSLLPQTFCVCVYVCVGGEKDKLCM